MTEGAPSPREPAGKPFLLHVAGLLLLLFGIPQALFVGVMVSEAVAGPPEGTFGVLGIDGLTSAEFLAVSPVVILAVAGPLVLGYGLVRGRLWARPLGASLWLGLGVLLGGVQVLGGAGTVALLYRLLPGIVGSGLAGWYLYGSRRVVRYYDELARSSPRNHPVRAAAP